MSVYLTISLMKGRYMADGMGGGLRKKGKWQQEETGTQMDRRYLWLDRWPQAVDGSYEPQTFTQQTLHQEKDIRRQSGQHTFPPGRKLGLRSWLH